MDRELGELGMFGLGTMGRNLALNVANRGHSLIAYNRTTSKVDDLLAEAAGQHIRGAKTVAEFVQQLGRPRAIMMMVPAGVPVDAAIEQLRPFLEPGDVVIDGGNSHFRDTERRASELSKNGLYFIGMGVSGGSQGARHGPSLMPGGDRTAYERVRELFEAVAARVGDEPCITYLGRGAAGHYVKMVHNGIEYGIMQLLAESYDFMGRGLGLSNQQMQTVFEEWNQGELSSYLVEITAAILQKVDDRTGGYLIDHILDQAKQKGTGKWTSQDAHELGVPTPSIDTAVIMRYISARKVERLRAGRLLSLSGATFSGNKERVMNRLRNAFYVAMLLNYAQGMDLIRVCSVEREYNIDMEGVARIWRGGCIIRAALLEKLRDAYLARPDLTNLLLDPSLASLVREHSADLRFVAGEFARLAIPGSSYMAALSYLDSYATKRLPANLIQAQRDYFGAHGYQRLDADGIFHSDWRAV